MKILVFCWIFERSIPAIILERIFLVKTNTFPFSWETITVQSGANSWSEKINYRWYPQSANAFSSILMLFLSGVKMIEHKTFHSSCHSWLDLKSQGHISLFDKKTSSQSDLQSFEQIHPIWILSNMVQQH